MKVEINKVIIIEGLGQKKLINYICIIFIYTLSTTLIKFKDSYACTCSTR